MCWSMRSAIISACPTPTWSGSRPRPDKARQSLLVRHRGVANQPFRPESPFLIKRLGRTVMRILITGAAGMIGRKLAERLGKDGHLGGKEISALILTDIVVSAFPASIDTSDIATPGEAARLIT